MNWIDFNIILGLIVPSQSIPSTSLHQGASSTHGWFIAIIIETCFSVRQQGQGSRRNRRVDLVCRPTNQTSICALLFQYEEDTKKVQYLTHVIPDMFNTWQVG